ncbi:hypothetical protein Leryth_009576 [Lithospermum erythrorhizon]|nr:hypothetical protein Leryth_009576 [Lithospermum erythrorhizon]
MEIRLENMCGILAVLGCSDSSQAKRFRILELSNRLKHRGPDWRGFYQHGDYYLAHQRLAIVDPASGNQPLFNENKNIVAIVNGGIYNHEQLKKQLRNHQFLTGSDCDVIVHLYEEYGEKFVNMLDGMFSFVLLDTRDNSFLVARDAIGITSLYIGWGNDGSIWISSELKGLKDDTEHFEVFPPGFLYSSKTGVFRRWYNPPWFCKAIPSTPYDPIVLRTALENAVIKSLMGDVSSGVLLSGGIGSSLVAAIASRYLSGAEVSRKCEARLRSFCIGLKGSSKLKAAREVADYLGTTHHEFHFTVQDGIDAIEEVIYHIETYDVMTIRATIPMFLMSRKIKSLGLKMVVSDEGSDELFGRNFNLNKYFNKEELHRDICREMESLHHNSCIRANKATYAFGLETRVPFLDNEFINVAMNIDPKWKMIQIKPDLGFIEKWILRRAFDHREKPYLPKHILYRQEEQFSINGLCDRWIEGLKFHAEQHVYLCLK